MKKYELLTKALDFSKEKHDGQKRDNGQPYFSAHIIKVVFILEKVTDDPEIIAAGYLHDTLEDTNTTFEELDELFGNRVASLVLEVTKTGYNKFPNLKTRDAVLIKFADRLQNLSCMESWNEPKRNQYILKSKFWK